jgi:hypothetical protein
MNWSPRALGSLSTEDLLKPTADNLRELPDVSAWDQRPRTQIIPEKKAAASPYVGGSDRKPRNLRTLRRWRKARRGPQFIKIGGRYFYTVGALREFFERSVRGGNYMRD